MFLQFVCYARYGNRVKNKEGNLLGYPLSIFIGSKITL